MRVGSYEERQQAVDLDGPVLHRIILPTFIPQIDGYFKHALSVLDLCLRSLRLSLDRRAAVSLVANGCCEEVIDRLEQEWQLGWLDQLVINVENRGKVDAVVGVARASHEPLITISDSDTLFCEGWLGAVETLFRAFPEAGAVAPIPNPRLVHYHTSATIIGAKLKRELHWASVVSAADLNKFADSVGDPHFFRDEDYEKQRIVRRGGRIACVGCGHFSFTIRREVVEAIPSEPSLTAVSGTSEELWLDRPVDRLGLWRLSTIKSYVHHIGNVPEPWMEELVLSLDRQSVETSAVLDRGKRSRLPYPFRRAIIKLLALLRPQHRVE